MTTRRAFTLIEVLVVAAILLTLVCLLWPAFSVARAAARRGGDTVEEPQQTYRLYTAKHDNHWWVMHPECVLHHPDCPCGGRKAEKEVSQ